MPVELWPPHHFPRERQGLLARRKEKPSSLRDEKEPRLPVLVRLASGELCHGPVCRPVHQFERDVESFVEARQVLDDPAAAGVEHVGNPPRIWQITADAERRAEVSDFLHDFNGDEASLRERAAKKYERQSLQGCVVDWCWTTGRFLPNAEATCSGGDRRAGELNPGGQELEQLN